MKQADLGATNGTSFHGVTITSTVNLLTKALWEPDGGDQYKSYYDWSGQLDDGTAFTIYDWKEYREVGEDDIVQFHIGGFSKEDCYKALREIRKKIS